MTSDSDEDREIVVIDDSEETPDEDWIRAEKPHVTVLYKCSKCGNEYEDFSGEHTDRGYRGRHDERLVYTCRNRTPGLFPTKCRGTVHSHPS